MPRHLKLGLAMLIVGSVGLSACTDYGPGRHRPPPRHDRWDDRDHDRRHDDRRWDRRDDRRDRDRWDDRDGRRDRDRRH